MCKKQILLLVLPLILILAACSAGASASSTGEGAAAGQSQNQTSQTPQAPDMSNQPIEQKLAVGTLMLEDTDSAITAEQAKTLLPLWKAVKALGSDSNAAQQELSSVYTQIQEAMTDEQAQAIQDMNLTMEDTRALMEKYGIEMPQNPGGEQLSESERATRVAQFQAQRGSQSGGQGERMPGGMPPGEFPGGMPGGGPQGGTQSGTPSAQGTPQPGRGARGMRSGGFNLMFVDALIKMLTERAGA